jgi:hypothetical protein
MKKQYETEVWGALTKDEFEKFLAIFSKKFGEPKNVNRLSMQITDYARHDLDTRIRVTNGEAEIMQKIGDWDAATREELFINVSADTETIYKHWRVLNNILNQKTALKTIMQMQNYVFTDKDYEIKLTHQFGKSDHYSFEVEVFQGNESPVEICDKLGLKPDLTLKDAEFWDAFNKKVNIQAQDLKDKEVEAILSAWFSTSKKVKKTYRERKSDNV